MRVGLIAPPWLPVPPLGYGGTEAVVDYLARELDRRGHTVVLCAPGDSTCPVDIYSPMVESVGLNADRFVKWELAHVIDSYQFLEEWQPDVIHDHTLAGPLISLGYEMPVVTTNHNTFRWEHEITYQMLANHGVPIVAISHHQASTTRAPLAGVVYNGVDTYAVDLCDGGGGYALCITRFDDEKGVTEGIRVALEARIDLKIIAKPPSPGQRIYFEEQVDPWLNHPAIEWVGEVTGKQRAELIGGAFCLINPIKWDEPFGMVMIDALAQGTPVVSMERGAATEIVRDGETGYLCDSQTSMALGVELCKRGDIHRPRCREDAIQRFSVQRMVTSYLEIYEDVVRGNW